MRLQVPAMQKKKAQTDRPTPRYKPVIILVILIILISMISYLLFQPGNEGLDLRPEPLYENDIGIFLVNPSPDGTEFQIEVKNIQRTTIYYEATFQYYYFIYNSTGDQIDTWLMDGYFQVNNSETFIEVSPGGTHALNENINTDGYAEGTYYVSVDFYIRDYYDDVCVYSSERMEFTV